MWVAFVLQKLLTLLQQNINVSVENTKATSVNEFVINKLVTQLCFEQPGPG